MGGNSFCVRWLERMGRSAKDRRPDLTPKKPSRPTWPLDLSEARSGLHPFSLGEQTIWPLRRGIGCWLANSLIVDLSMPAGRLLTPRGDMLLQRWWPARTLRRVSGLSATRLPLRDTSSFVHKHQLDPNVIPKGLRPFEAPSSLVQWRRHTSGHRRELPPPMR